MSSRLAGNPPEVVAAAPRTLREASTTAQLVVAGSRGRGGFRGLVHGSTGLTLLHQAACPPS